MSSPEFPSKRAAAYQNVPIEQWSDWRWQLSHRLNSLEDFEPVLELTESERTALSAKDLFRVDITPYFVSLIDPKDPNDPIRRQVIPTAAEMTKFTGMMEDSLSEDAHWTGAPLP
jgi:lysine 2,3-aminomutase